MPDVRRCQHGMRLLGPRCDVCGTLLLCSECNKCREHPDKLFLWVPRVVPNMKEWQ
jgi:hypothetical protein